MRFLRVGAGWWAMCAVVLWAACGGEESASSSDPAPTFALEAEAVAVPDGVPPPMRACYECHADVVDEYLQHGMAQSLGPAGTPAPGTVANPISGNQYALYVNAEGAWLKGTTPEGGTRTQRIVGRIGAGRFDTSWIGAEVDPFTGQPTRRLFFAPVETLTDYGLTLSPFELMPGSAGLDLGLTEGCLTCHTDTDPATLPGAAVAPDGQTVYPAHALGADAFDALQPLGCEACHGDTRRHVTMMAGLPDEGVQDLGLESLVRSPAPRQRDVCARCHLQGDARIELMSGRPSASAPLAGQIPTLVPVHQAGDFRFVGQLERLALSACFKASPAMTCTTCHEAHSAVARQGTASFDAACQGCHTMEADHTSLTVEAVTGEAARTEAGCVDCHVRRSQPFDLPHLRTADHFIRRTIPRPEDDIPHRQFADPDGAVEVFDDGRLADALNTPAGRRWAEGVVAMGLVSMGRMEEAAERFSAFPPPGDATAVVPTAPDGLIPLETDGAFHHLRGLALMATERPEAALAAFTDALALDPYYAGARMERARLYLLLGDVQRALKDTDVVLEAHPGADKPWSLRATMALRTGHAAMAAAALEAATQRWPSDANTWHQLAVLYARLGQPQRAHDALSRARLLDPSLPTSADAPPAAVR